VLRLALIFLSTLLLWAMTAQLNHALAPWRLYVFVGALAVTLPALTFSFVCMTRGRTVGAGVTRLRFHACLVV
jgi:hypothetical protein